MGGTRTRLLLPNLSEDRIVGVVVGLRPYRTGAIRLEADEVRKRPLIHNYGHGGAGVTLSWGSALEAADLLAERLKPPSSIAVLGAGVVGLSTALVLLERGYSVRIYAGDFPPETTSNIAGAEWLPYGVAAGQNDVERARFRRVALRSKERFEALATLWPNAVYRRYAYEPAEAACELPDVPEEVIPLKEDVARLPFGPEAMSGYRYETYFIDTAIYLPRLFREALVRGAVAAVRRFRSPQDLVELPEAGFVNCLGLGAGSVFSDASIVPVRGQLVHLIAEPLPYLFVHKDGYVFARRECIIVGGSFEIGETSLTPDPTTTRRILERARDLLLG